MDLQATSNIKNFVRTLISLNFSYRPEELSTYIDGPCCRRHGLFLSYFNMKSAIKQTRKFWCWIWVFYACNIPSFFFLLKNFMQNLIKLLEHVYLLKRNECYVYSTHRSAPLESQWKYRIYNDWCWRRPFHSTPFQLLTFASLLFSLIYSLCVFLLAILSWKFKCRFNIFWFNLNPIVVGFQANV